VNDAVVLMDWTSSIDSFQHRLYSWSSVCVYLSSFHTVRRDKTSDDFLSRQSRPAVSVWNRLKY